MMTVKHVLLAFFINLHLSLGNHAAASYPNTPQEYAPLPSAPPASSLIDSEYIAIPIDDPKDSPSPRLITAQPAEIHKNCLSRLFPAQKAAIKLSAIIIGLGAFSALVWFVMGHFCVFDSDVFNCTNSSSK